VSNTRTCHAGLRAYDFGEYEKICYKKIDGNYKKLKQRFWHEETYKFFCTRTMWLVVLPADLNGKSWRFFAERGEQFLAMWEPLIIDGWESRPVTMSRADMSGSEAEEYDDAVVASLGAVVTSTGQVVDVPMSEAERAEWDAAWENCTWNNRTL
jgi:hypothetical protein